MSGLIILGIGVVVVAVGIIIAVQIEQQKLAAMSPAERERYLLEKQEAQLTAQWGPLNPVMVCPHCQVQGKIRTKPIIQKKGISGGKATAAVITGGLSVLATGLSRKENATQVFCGNCNNTWVF